MKYYIAYGSNLNTEQMAHRCPNAKVVGTSYLKDYQLLFKGSKTGSYLTVEKKKGSKVPVAIWRVTAEDEKALDHYEGYPIFYYKKRMRMNDGREAFMYVMHEDRELGQPSSYYVEVCKRGYENFGFDPAYIDRAIEVSR